VCTPRAGAPAVKRIMVAEVAAATSASTPRLSSSGALTMPPPTPNMPATTPAPLHSIGYTTVVRGVHSMSPASGARPACTRPPLARRLTRSSMRGHNAQQQHVRTQAQGAQEQAHGVRARASKRASRFRLAFVMSDLRTTATTAATSGTMLSTSAQYAAPPHGTTFFRLSVASTHAKRPTSAAM
jgi:hypothetical protein